MRCAKSNLTPNRLQFALKIRNRRDICGDSVCFHFPEQERLPTRFSSATARMAGAIVDGDWSAIIESLRPRPTRVRVLLAVHPTIAPD